jgi:hypothetical protein
MRMFGYRREIAALGIAALAAAALPIVGFAAEPLLFQFEQQAQHHCPTDSVVWASAELHLFNVKGERWYGTTKGGAYMCRRDAEQAGYRPRRTAT